MKAMTPEKIKVLLDGQADAQALKAAAAQRNLEHGRLAYCNTLAVHAVHTYLSWVQIHSNLEEDEESVPERLVTSLADLLIEDYGRLECCVFLPGQTTYAIPPTIGERIGYLGVHLGENLREAYLFGFVSASSLQPGVEYLRETDFGELDSLFYTLEALKAGIVVRLRDWLVGQFDATWHGVNELLHSGKMELASRFRSEGLRAETSFIERAKLSFRSEGLRAETSIIERAKLLDLGLHLGGQSLILVVALSPNADHRYAISVQVLPDAASYLPKGISLAILDEEGKALPPPVISRELDNYIQRSFYAREGEQFTVSLRYQNTTFEERFAI